MPISHKFIFRANTIPERTRTSKANSVKMSAIKGEFNFSLGSPSAACGHSPMENMESSKLLSKL